MKRQFFTRWLTLLGILCLTMLMLTPGSGSRVRAAQISQEAPEIDPDLLQQLNRSGSASYLITFEVKADLTPAYAMDWQSRGRFVFSTLTQASDTAQKDVRVYLDQQGVTYQTFWIENVILVEASARATLQGLLSYPEIDSVDANPVVHLIEPVEVKDEAEAPGIRSTETNLTQINADVAWSLGYTGAGMVVGSIDTGGRYTHEALFNQYRGNLGGSIDHNYSWWDAVNNKPIPYDDYNHGTHTIGIMVGDDGGANQIGIAPEAGWIACKALSSTGSGKGSDLLECAEFMLAPTQQNGNNPNPDLRPQVVNNSWGDCGKTYNPWFEGAIDAWVAAGIYPVFANGNAGNCGYSSPPGLGTVGNPARSSHVTAVGSTGRNNGEYAPHSNWGPTDNLDTLNPMGYPNLKPQVVAPGASIRSSISSPSPDDNDNYGTMSGTSMSAPHVSGLIALLWQSGTCLLGDYIHTETLLQQSANPIPYDTGNGDEGPGNVPNHATGWGEIDAEQAVIAAQYYCGDSTISGLVRDASSNPLTGVALTATAQTDPANSRTATTSANGAFTIPVESGDSYILSASAYGFYTGLSSEIPIVNPGTTHTENFSLSKKPLVTLSGTVSDGSGHPYPLYAQVEISAEGFESKVLSNPFDGSYQITLYQETPYDLMFTSRMGGYASLAETGVTFAAPTATRHAALSVGDHCDAPGYKILSGIYQPFSESTQPSDWTVVDIAGTGVVWRFDDPAGRSNFTGGSGRFAIVDSDYAGYKQVNTALISPSMDYSGQATVTVAFDQDFSFYPGSTAEVADVDVSVGGGAWQNVLRQTEGARGPNHQELNISEIAGNQSDVRVRFHYYNAIFDYWWQVDNIRLGPYTCAVQPGGILSGFVTREEDGAPLNDIRISGAGAQTFSMATLEDPTLPDGYYWFFQPLTSNPQTISLTVGGGVYIPVVVAVPVDQDRINRQDFFLDSYQVFIPSLFR